MTREQAEAFLGAAATNAPAPPPTNRFAVSVPALPSPSPAAAPMESELEYNPRFINRFALAQPAAEPAPRFDLPRVERAPYWSRSPLVQDVRSALATAEDRASRQWRRGADIAVAAEALPRTVFNEAFRRGVVEPALSSAGAAVEGFAQRAKPVLSWFDRYYQTRIKPPPLYLTPEQAQSLLIEAGGDKERARQLARERGYQW